jgi:hypothetical protein
VEAAAGSQPVAAPIPLRGPITIDDPASAQQVSDAYVKYFQVSADALYDLDPTPLDAVAAGAELDALRYSIERDRTEGRALKTDVKHNYLVVWVQGDDADIADHYSDSSIWVDATTKQALPGEVAPTSEAPIVSILYHLHRVDGAWKVVSAESYTCAGSTNPACSSESG